MFFSNILRVPLLKRYVRHTPLITRITRVPRTCSSDMYSDMLKLSAYSKEPGESGGPAAWRGRNVNTSSTSGTCVELVPLVLKLSESNFGGVQCRVSAGNPCIPGISLFRGGFPKWLIFYLRGSQHSSVQHLTSSCEFEGAHRLSSFSKVHQDLSENGMSDIPPP